MNLKLTTLIFTVFLSQAAMALPVQSLSTDGSTGSSESRTRAKPYQGDLPSTSGYAAAQPTRGPANGAARASSSMTEEEMACVIWGSCKPQHPSA